MDLRVKNGFFPKEKPVYRIGYNETIIELYQLAINTATRQEPHFQQLLAGIVNHMLGLVFMARSHRLHQRSKTLLIIDKAKTFLQEQIESDITMQEVAEHLNLSYSAFRHLFKKHIGISPTQYYKNLKLHRAKEMLKGTTMSIKEIAYTLHFESPEYFSTTFRKKTGMSPSEFRNA